MLGKASVVAIGALAGQAVAHGFVSQIKAGANWFEGGSPNWAYQNPVIPTVGWHAGNQDNGFVGPETYKTSDIICHKSATQAELSVPVKAGDSLTLFWNTWPESHKGPIINYLASCNGDCTTVDKTKLSFAKVSEAAVVDAATNHWVTDDLITNNFTSIFTVPSSVKAGNYVLRHEIIALHSAGEVGGAQNYPQCINLEVTGDGTSIPSGYAGTDLYTEDEEGIVFNLYNGFTQYPIPGPALWDGACSA